MSDPSGDFLLAQTASRVQYVWEGLESLSQWWQFAALVGLIVLAASGVLWLYRRDTRGMAPGTRVALAMLRLVALAAIVVFFLHPQRRHERLLVRHSRLVMLVDTSQSMAVADDPSGQDKGTTRIAQVIDTLQKQSWLQRLREKHDVFVYRFDRSTTPAHVATLTKRTPAEPAVPSQGAPRSGRATHRDVTMLFGLAAALAVLGLAGAATSGLLQWRAVAFDPGTWLLPVSLAGLFAGLGLAAVLDLVYPDWSPWARRSAASHMTAVAPDPAGQPEDGPVEPAEPVRWDEQLQPRGATTRIGDALRWVVQRERGGPVAGVVLLTDGRSNAGLDVEAAVAEAAAAEIPVYPIGLGSDRVPQNVRVVQLEAPPRAYPRDQFQLTGFLQGYGWEGRTVQIDLVALPPGVSDPEKGRVLQQQQVQLGADGQVQTIEFQWAEEETGPKQYRLVARPPQGQDSDPRDNQAAARVEVTDRRNRVLLVAGGPTREYRFVRNLLHRDPQVQTDVWLQSAPQGAAQEASQVLYGFPQDAATLFEYDCILAFDPDWTQLNADQVELLERWVGEKAGGLILVAGPIHTPQWAESRSSDRRWDTIRALYPVVFYGSGLSTVRLGRFGSETAWPLAFTQEGLEAPFLWLADSGPASRQLWEQFPGVYSYYGVRGPKPGATVYARYSDPQEAVGQQQPPYLVGQFYGAGRTLYFGSGEMWRMRAIDEGLFERLWTKLIRHVSEGRLLQDSNRGILIVGKPEYQLGETVVVQASLADPQFRPLELAEVTMSVETPEGERLQVPLRKLGPPARPGSYSGQLTADQQGTYRLELPLPGGPLELLQREVQVRIPQHEVQRPQRNDTLLARMARQTGGHYFVGLQQALQGNPGPALAATIANRDRHSYLPGTLDRYFDERLMQWLLGWTVAALCAEWLIRRLHKLA